MNAARTAHRFLVLAFIVLLPLQFLFAGYGAMSGEYGAHELYGGVLLHAITLLMFVSGLVARQWRSAGLSFALFAAIFVQIFLVVIGQDNDQPWISALHPFLAFCYWPFTWFYVWQPLQLEHAAGDASARPEKTPERVETAHGSSPVRAPSRRR